MLLPELEKINFEHLLEVITLIPQYNPKRWKTKYITSDILDQKKELVIYNYYQKNPEVTSLFVGWTFTSTCSEGNTSDIYMKGFDALGNVAA